MKDISTLLDEEMKETVRNCAVTNEYQFFLDDLRILCDESFEKAISQLPVRTQQAFRGMRFLSYLCLLVVESDKDKRSVA